MNNTNFRGRWSPYSTYEKGDIVVDSNENRFVCTASGGLFDTKFERLASKDPTLADVAKIAAKHAIDTIKLTTNKEPKMKKGIKPRMGDRLVFTYTNGKTFTVRGLMFAEVAGMSIHYKTHTTDASGNITKQEVTRRITNDFSTVVIEHSSGYRSTLLDLRSERTEDTPKPTRTKKSREEWEALEAQKAAELEKRAKVEQLLSEAEKLLGT